MDEGGGRSWREVGGGSKMAAVLEVEVGGPGEREAEEVGAQEGLGGPGRVIGPMGARGVAGLRRRLRNGGCGVALGGSAGVPRLPWGRGAKLQSEGAFREL